jgi:DNA-nicking Smr family endonuclease
MAKNRESRTLGKSAGKHAAGDHLSAQERALWEHAARDLKPLKTKKARVHGAQAAQAETPQRRAPHAEGMAAGAPKPPAAGPATSPAAKAGPPPPLAELDRRKARAIGSGRIEVEARIDLHGMRQSEAHVSLRRFLMRAHADGCRWVLVITGKGRSQRRRSDPDDIGYGGEEERGVLRRSVPGWLAEPELRAIVVGFTPAAIRHGGEGALYVQLRRRERSSGRR